MVDTGKYTLYITDSIWNEETEEYEGRSLELEFSIDERHQCMTYFTRLVAQSLELDCKYADYRIGFSDPYYNRAAWIAEYKNETARAMSFVFDGEI
jgi:hypothetical protein